MKKYKLGEIADIITGPFGSQLHASDYVEKGVPSIMPKDIGDRIVIHDTIAHITEEDAIRLSKYRVNLGDIVYSRRGDIERCALITETDVGALCGTGCLRVRPDKDIVNSVFLSFYLSTPHIRKWVVDNATGATMPNLNSDILKKLPVELPDLKEQCRIANDLQTIDDKINNNSKLITTLESIAKTLYDYWFVQFDFPDENGHPYKTSGGKMEWNETLSREIPAGWEVGQVSDLGEVVAGGTPSTEHPDYFTSDGIAWITPKDMSLLDGKYIFHGATDISEEGLKNSSAKLMPAGSVVYTTRAPIGYVAIAGNDVCTNQGFKSVVPKENFGTEFVYYTLKSLEVHFKNVGNGSTFSEVSKENFSTVPICIPKVEVIRGFMDAVDRLSNMQKKAQLENRKLNYLKEFLLPMLMNGQVHCIN